MQYLNLKEIYYKNKYIYTLWQKYIQIVEKHTNAKYLMARVIPIN